jgi:hypothetical protein
MIQRMLHTLVHNAQLDHRVLWREQPKEKIVKICQIVCAYLSTYLVID